MTILELQTALERHYGAELLGQMLDREVIRLEGNETGTSIGSAEINRELKRMQQGYESEQQFYDIHAKSVRDVRARNQRRCNQ